MRINNKLIFLVLFLFRLSSLYFVQSSFVPDEYWQSLEISHKLTYGFGYLTWEWKKKIRSYFYPFIIHLIYKIIPDSSTYIIYAPRIFQGILTSIGDFFAYKFAADNFGKSCGYWTLFNLLASWFLFYCSTRTLTNMAEASLTSCGFYFYPWSVTKRFRSKYLWFAGLSSLIRPTAAVTWLPLYLWHIFREKQRASLLKDTFVIGFTMLSGMLFIDKWCYGDWVLTPYNFLLFNWKNDIGAFYGSHPFLWYFYMGLPTVLGLQFIPFLCGLSLPQFRPFYWLILWFLTIFSFLSHKEFRFLLPILPMCMIICGAVMNKFWLGRTRIKISRRIIGSCAFVLILFNGLAAYYTGSIHQTGVIRAVHHLSTLVKNDSKVLFLMPCHSTPYYSHIHMNIKMRFLTCEPNFENDPNYIDEADKFFMDPNKWLSENIESKHLSMPSHIVMFDSLYPDISMFLIHHQYSACFSAFHSHFPDKRIGRNVHIYCK